MEKPLTPYEAERTGQLSIDHEKAFVSVEVEIQEVGKHAIRFALMTPEEHAFWWEHGSEHPRFGPEMLGPEF
jgi:hypothetical protein